MSCLREKEDVSGRVNFLGTGPGCCRGSHGKSQG